MKLAIITLHYRNLTDTLELLDSLSQCHIPAGSEVTIYVVDNENSPDLKNALAEKYSRARLLASGSNLGFAAGNNLGLRAALADNHDILVAINNDTYVSHDFYRQILAGPIGQPAVGAVGGLIYFAPGFEYQKKYSAKEKGKVIWYAGGSFDWNNILGSNAWVDEVDRGQFKKTTETDFITGALFVTRSDVLRKVGLFDEKYFMYLEDVDLCVRLKKAGFSLILDPQLKIWHKVAQGSSIGSTLNDYFITRNRLYFAMKYARFRTKFALLREACRFLLTGRPAQKQAVVDYLKGKLGKGSYIKS